MKNIKFETIIQTTKGEKHYMLFEVLLESKSAYCMVAEDDSLAVQGIGNDYLMAKKVYELLSCGEVSSVHMADVINDIRQDFRNEIFL